MILMPSNSTGWFWHSLARETGKLGHLYSPGGQRGPWPWFPFAFDNGAFSCWDSSSGEFDYDKWERSEGEWRELIRWGLVHSPMWAIVPDVPGDAEATLRRWRDYSHEVPFKRAIAVQDGMLPQDIRHLRPDVVAVGGSTKWKWDTVAMWAYEFDRVHVLRVNSPARLVELDELGVESCDGTGWARGDSKQTAGAEDWARGGATHRFGSLWPFVCKGERRKRSRVDNAGRT